MGKFSSLAAVVLTLGVASAGRAVPNDHFHPSPSTWSDNAWDDAPIAKVVFREAFAGDVVLRLHMSTSLIFTERMIALRKDANGRYAILALQTDGTLAVYTPGAIRSFGTKRRKLRDYRAIHPARCDVPLASALADRIAAVWRGVLLRAHYDADPVRGLDGAGFDAWMRDDKAGQLAGSVWSPDGGTPPAMLIAIAEAMSDYCATPDATHLAAIAQRTTALEHRLAAR